MASLYRHISLQLIQDCLTAEVHLKGDILQDDCLVLSSDHAFVTGSPADLHIFFQHQSFNVVGEVEHCRKDDEDTYVVHFHLLHPDKLQTRMLLQLSEIEQYRQYLLTRGREVSIDEAADEWVKRYAEDFATEFDAEHQH